MNIDHRAKVSLYAALSALPFLIGGIMWLTTVDNKATAAQNELNILKQLLLDVRERVIRIEEQVKR